MDFGQIVNMSEKDPEKPESRQYNRENELCQETQVSSFLSSFLSKNLRTTQLVVNTDEKTLRPIARLKEPRDLFALPKDKDNDCSQQAPRWPIECQVLDERITHIPYVPAQPEPLNQPTGNELKPRPVGEENGIVVFNYNPISAVNYDRQDSSDSETMDTIVNYHLPEDDPLQCLINSATSSSDEEEPDSNKKLEKVQEEPNTSNQSESNEKLAKKLIPRAFKRIKRGSKRTIDKESIDMIWKNQMSGTLLQDQGLATISAHTPVLLNSSQLSRLELAARKSYIESKSSGETIKQDKSKLSSTNTSISSSSNSSLSSESESSDTSDGGNEGGQSSSDEAEDTASQNRNLIPARPPINRNMNHQNQMNHYPPRQEAGGTSSDRSQNLAYDSNQEQIQNQNQKKDEIDMLFPPPKNKIGSGNTIDRLSDNSNLINPNKNESTDPYNEKEFVLPQFSRSAVGGAKFVSNCHPYDPTTYDGLEFESRFESGNLAKAVQITRTYYELYLRPDLYTSRSRQWFYFRVKRTKRNLVYRFSIVNLIKSDSLFNDGMRPVMYSTIDAKEQNIGWRRCGDNIAYYRNDDDSTNPEEEDENSSYTLTFNIEFRNDNDTVYFAHCYPYTYSDLQDYLMEIQNNPVKSQFCKLRLLCRTLAGNNVYYLTVTAPSTNEETIKKKRAIVVSARVHPSETPASWMMKGLMDFLTGDSTVAKRLRHRFIFKLIPMLNPDGVIVGNTRNSLAGKDLNRQYRTVIRETYPSIWYTKALIKRLIDECGVAMYCDMHAHSRKHNIFIYGCENRRNPEKRLTEQVFPLMLHKNVADKFSFESCKFKIQRSKEGTGRIVVWMLGITNSYTIEASFGGSTLGSRKGTHFNVADYEHMGRTFCETLLDYYDDHPNKVKKQDKVLKQVKKLRKREKREQKALKLKKMADQERLRLKIIERLLKEGSSAEEPLNIPLSDYSSDEGNLSSSSDNEGKLSITVSDLEGPCCAPLKAPPCSPEIDYEARKFRYKRMKKIMAQLDKVYFQPLLHKKFQTLFKGSTIKQKSYRIQKKKPQKKKTDIAELLESVVQPNSTNSQELSTSTTSTSTNNGKVSIRTTPKATSQVNQIQQQRILQAQQLQLPKGSTLFLMKNSCSPNSCAKKSQQNSQKGIVLGKEPKSITPTSTAETSLTSNEVSRDPKEIIQKKILRKKRRFKIKRAFRLWLLARNIVISRKNKRRRKHFKRKKAAPKRSDRLPLDMPTTDPGSDIHFSTDDEFQFTKSKPKYRTNISRQKNLVYSSNDLTKRCMDGQEAVSKIPPELIITSPNRYGRDPYGLRAPSTAPNTLNNHSANLAQGNGLLKFPTEGFGQLNKRTNSWHSLSSSSTRIQKMRNNMAYDDLQMKLSLKKKLYSGINNDGTHPNTATNTDTHKSLSWYQPHQSTSSTIAALMKEKPNASAPNANSKTLKKIDINAVLLNECSNKLLMWQQREALEEGLINNTEKKSGGAKGDSKPKVSYKLVPPSASRSNAEECLKRFLHSKSEAYSRQKQQNAASQQQYQSQQLYQQQESSAKTETSKAQKPTPLAKFAETTQIIHRFSKTKGSRTNHSNGLKVTKSNTSLNTGGAGNHSNSQRAPGTNKFKTGGIVVTAVQPSEKKTKKTRSYVVPNYNTNNAAAPQTQMGTSNSNTSINAKEKYQNMHITSSNNHPTIPSLVESKTILKTFKTKIKKKKSTKPKIIDLSEIARHPVNQ